MSRENWAELPTERLVGIIETKFAGLEPEMRQIVYAMALYEIRTGELYEPPDLDIEIIKEERTRALMDFDPKHLEPIVPKKVQWN